MDAFKESMNKIHVPDALLLSTMEKMHAENEAFQSEAEDDIHGSSESHTQIIPFRRRRGQIVAAAACVCLLLSGAAVYQSSTIPWNEIDSSAGIYYRDVSDTDTVSSEEFRIITGLDLGVYASLDDYAGSACSLTTDESGTTYLQADIQFVKDGVPSTLTISEAEPSMAESLSSARTKRIHGTPVLFAVDSSINARYAIWTVDDLWFVVRAAGVDGKSFSGAVSALVDVS